MLNKNIITIAFLLISLSGCSLYNRIMKSDDCADGKCDTPKLLDNTNTKQDWYCYGKNEGGSWDCVNTQDASKIRHIVPRPETNQYDGGRLGQSIETLDAGDQETVDLATTSEPEKQAVDNHSRSSKTNALILASPAESYTVQLIAMKSESRVLAFAKLNGILEPIYARINSQNADWYVLLLGIYPDKQSAEAAKETWMTAKTLKVKPWIRQLGPLQDAIGQLQD